MTESARRWLRTERAGVFLVGGAVVLGFVILLFWKLIFVVILPGQGGVLYDLFFGTRLGAHSREGLTVKFPWNFMYIYDVRLQSRAYTVSALSREGMYVDIDVVVLFRPIIEELPLLHKEIGPDYIERTIGPQVIGAVREYVADHGSEEMYTVDARDLKRDIMNATRVRMAHHHVHIDDIILQRLTLPKAILEAVEQKLIEQQRADAYGFRLAAEKAEAERLAIKGPALSRYYSLVNSALTPSLLTWRGIEATVELAQSPNSKVVVVGNGKNQLPIILGSDIAQLPEARSGAPGGNVPADAKAPPVFKPESRIPAKDTPGPVTPSSGSARPNAPSR